jgi:hypothetical protein
VTHLLASGPVAAECFKFSSAKMLHTGTVTTHILSACYIVLVAVLPALVHTPPSLASCLVSGPQTGDMMTRTLLFPATIM